LNFAGKPGSTSSGLFSTSHIGAVELPHHGHAGAITVPDPYLLFSGDYKRSGPDLILSKDGREHVVENYFVGEKRAALAAPDGASLSGDIVSALTGHVQFAQASGAVDAGKVIGHVTKLAGNATAIRNGVSIVLNMGDNVHKGDVVQSGSNSSLGITFIDGTVFGLASNARMVLNEMVYDPNGSSNSSFLTLVQGTITFVAGQTAKHGDMKVDTPVATMGIRGTACLVEVGFDIPVFDPSTSVALSIPVKFQVLQEADGSVGSYVLFAKTDLTYSNPIATINRAGEVTAFNANGQITNYQVTLIAPEVKALIDQTLKLYFPNYNPQIPGSTPANPVTPDAVNKQPINFQTDKPTTVPLDYTFSDPNHPGATITRTTEVTVTLHNTAPTVTVNPVADKPTFQIKDQVVITDPDDPGVNPASPFNDVPHPYVAGSGKVESATGPATTPAGLDLAALVHVDSATGTVSYNPESFAFLKGGDKVVVTIAFDANSGPDTVHQTLTLTIDGVNDAPTVSSAVTGGGAEGSGLATVNLLNFASDADAGAVLHVENLVRTDAGSGFPTGVTLSADGASLLVDTNNHAYDHLAQGASATAHFSYDVVDENGALAHQTATVSIAGSNDAPVTSAAVSETGHEGSGTFDVSLLKNASDVDDGAVLHVANLVRTDTGGGLPAGFALSPDGNSITVDTDGLVYNALAQGEAFTAHFGYDVVDEHGASVHQTAAVTITGANDAPVFTTGPTVTQLSVPADGVPFSRGETFAFGPSMSSDGRFVVFGASNQIPGQDDNSHLGDVYLYDRLTGTYKWISDPANFANSTPHAGETYHGLSTISLDGQFVTFRGHFQVTQIIGGQPVTSVQSETFLYNTSTGVTTLIPGLNGDEPSINANGSLIAATGQSLTAPSGNNFIYNDVLVTDRLGHVVTRISGDTNASPVNTADISPDGRYVTFWSTASQIEIKNVKPGGGPVDNLTFNVGATWPAGPSTPAGPVAQVYVFDRQTETINLVSVSPAGEMGNGNSSVLTLQTSAGFIDIGDDWKSAFSADGRFIIFQSNASNLVAGDSNGATDVFLYDLQTHQVQLVSAAADGSSANGASYRPAISADGHHIVFASDATNLLGGAPSTPTGATGFQTYIRDFDPATGLLSTGFAGFHNGDNQYGDSISRDGGIVAFGGAALAFNANQGQAEFISVAAGTIKFSGGSISDYNPAADTLTVTMSVAHGTLFSLVAVTSGSGVTIVGGFDGSQGTLKFTGSIDAINHAFDGGVTYTPTAVGPDALAMTVTDGHGGTAAHTVQFDPRAPQITGVSTIGNTIAFDHDHPQAQLLAQGQVKFSNDSDSVSDSTPGFNSNSGVLTVTVSVGHGTLTPVALGSGVTIVGGFDGHAGTLKFTGTLAAVNDALESGAIYAATPGGPDTITVTVADGHGGTATQSTQFNPLAPAIDAGLVDGQYEIFVVDRAGGSAGLVIEDSSLTAPNSGTLLTKGAFGFTDADLTDTHTATVIGSPVVDTSHAPGFIVPNGGLGTFTPLAVTESAGSGQVPWTFSVDNALVQSLGKGQYITQTYAVQLDDHHGGHATQNVTVTIAGVNDAPMVIQAALTISQGHTVTLTTADIDFVDPDSPVVSYAVSNLSHGHFETGVGNEAVETTTFTSADVVAGLVSFVDDGSSGTPTFSLTPNDGSIDGLTVNGVVTFSAANYTMTSTEGVTINVTPEGATSGFVFPGAGNVTTPGIPEDRIAIGYDVGASHVVLDNAPLLGVHQMASLSSETHSSGGTTFVSTTLDAGHGVTLVQTLALASDANFFTTTIDITNNGATDVSNLRFLRNFDPDQDVQAHNDYQTFNDVVQKPDGAETFAIVSAKGVESHTTVAMIGLGAEWQGSVFGFTNTDPYATGAFDTPVDPDGARDDKSLSLTSSLGTLAAGDHVEVTYITTNNVATSGSNALYGTAGADTINGLGGDDLLIGLGKADTFVFNAALGGSGHDTIADFTPGLDQISLDYHAFDAAAGPNDFSNWLRTHATDINNNINNTNDVLIDLNVDGLHPGVDTILLKNVVSTSLQAGDFHTL
jgi:VCBS repeat-containing protein